LTPGTRVSYGVDVAQAYRTLYLRCAMFGVRRLVLEVATPRQAVDVVLAENAPDAFIDYGDLRMARVALPEAERMQSVDLRVKAIELDGGVQSFVLDGILLSDADPASAASRFVLHAPDSIL